MNGPKRVVSAEELRALHHGAGMSVHQIANRFGVGKATIYGALERFDIELCKNTRVYPYRPDLEQALSRDALQSMLRDGMSVIQIAGWVDCTTPTVYRRIKEHGLSMPGVKVSQRHSPTVDIAQLRHLYLDEKRPILECAAELGVSARQVRNAMDDAGILRRQRGGVYQTRPHS